MTNETVDQTWVQREAASGGGKALAGLVLVWCGGRARLSALPLDDGSIELGRGTCRGVEIDDHTMSRKHARVRKDGAAWIIVDEGSRNGSAVDGVVLHGELRSDAARVLRCGDSLFLLLPDVRPFLGAQVDVLDGLVVGPRLSAAWRQIDGAAASGEVLHVTGETGAGKELAARRFHRSGPRARGPFVAVNCATIPANLAERLLFGAKKGAFSGADADVVGYVQAAHQGTLFLDELAELDLQVQAKLLRVLETREVAQLGATSATKVAFSLVSATHGALRERVDDGRFRADLFFRIGRPHVALPSLRDRAEEVPWLLQQALAPLGRPPHVSLVEAALLRPWPGNVRELLLEAKEAARIAGVAGADRVLAEHLAEEAGTSRAPTATTTTTTTTESVRARAPNVDVPPKDVVARALDDAGGNVSRAARALGVHRTQLRRWKEKHGL